MVIPSLEYDRKDNSSANMKGDIKMNIFNVIWEKECCNQGSIYLYCLDNSWKAFGHSAFYLSLLYPELEVDMVDNRGTTCFCVCLSDDYLMVIFEMGGVSVGNECIEVKVWDSICCGEDEYAKWCNKLSDIVEYE